MEAAWEVFFTNLYSESYDKLLNYASICIGSRDSAQELVQDTFHEAWRNADKLLGHPNPGGWLQQTLKYKILKYEKQHRQDVGMIMSLEQNYHAAEQLCYSMPEDPDDTAAAMLKRVKSTLTQEEYYLLKRVSFDGASHLTVSQELNISVWACQKRLERIRKYLNRLFAE